MGRGICLATLEKRRNHFGHQGDGKTLAEYVTYGGMINDQSPQSRAAASVISHVWLASHAAL